MLMCLHQQESKSHIKQKQNTMVVQGSQAHLNTFSVLHRLSIFNPPIL